MLKSYPVHSLNSELFHTERRGAWRGCYGRSLNMQLCFPVFVPLIYQRRKHALQKRKELQASKFKRELWKLLESLATLVPKLFAHINKSFILIAIRRLYCSGSQAIFDMSKYFQGKFQLIFILKKRS